MRGLWTAAMIGLCAAPATFADSVRWEGRILDSKCGGSGSHTTGPPTGSQMLTDAECTQLCIEAGAKYVFVSGGNVYSIASQKHKDIQANVGPIVQLAGDVNGSTITVSKISPSKKASKP